LPGWKRAAGREDALFRVRIEPAAAWVMATFLSHEAMLRLHRDVRAELATHLSEHRANCDPDDPNLFRLGLGITDGGILHWFTFSVDDHRQPDRLFVVKAVHQDLGPYP
jgi:hypothetical protein